MGVDPLSFYDGSGKWDVSHIFRKPITIAIKLLVLIASKNKLQAFCVLVCQSASHSYIRVKK